MISELTQAWTNLELGAQPDGITRRRFLPDAPLDLFVGLENPGMTRLFIAEANRTSFRPRRWTTCTGFTASQERVPGANERDRLVVRLLDPTAKDIFASLVADVISVGESGAVEDVLDRIAGRLERWQRFLERYGADGLTPQEQTGLYGELWFLENVVLSALPAFAAAVDAWTGPLAKNQDFQLPRACIEVKTSTSNPKDEVKITNVRQLDDTGTENLVLVHLALEARQTTGDTLPGLVDRLRLRLGEQTAPFNDRLRDAGYLDAHRRIYEGTSYAFKGRRNFMVRDDFPRIREAELRPGVVGVSYVISLSSCTPYVVGDDAVLLLLRTA